MLSSTLPPLDMLPELSAQSSASTSGSGPSQPATPADEDSFEHRMELFNATPRKGDDGDITLYDERTETLQRLQKAMQVLSRNPGTNMVRDISSTSAGGSIEESTTLELSYSMNGHQILVRSPTGDADSPSLSPDMPSIARSQTLYRQPNVTFGLTPVLGTLPSSSSLAGNVSHTGLSESHTTSTMSLASAPDSMLAIISPRPESEVGESSAALFPIISIGTPDPQFADRSPMAEGYEGDSDCEDEQSSLGSGDDYSDTLVSSASELDCTGLTELIMRKSSQPNESQSGDVEPFAPLEQNGSLFPLSLVRDLALTPCRLALLAAVQLLHPTLLPVLLFGSSHTLWPRSAPPSGGIRRLEAYAHALHGAGFTFLFTLLLLWQLGGSVGSALAIAALTRAAWVWGAFELDIDRAMGQNEDMACAWALLFGKEREVVGWMAQRARMEMDSGSQGRRAVSEPEPINVESSMTFLAEWMMGAK